MITKLLNIAIFVPHLHVAPFLVLVLVYLYIWVKGRHDNSQPYFSIFL